MSLGVSYQIFKINTITNKKTVVYDFIEDITEADLLAQLAMCQKNNIDELIYIAPGWNRSIDKNHIDQFNKALELAKKYKVD